ncbi:MAG: hypothetical protein JJU40_11035, partial [Rhodobacteraceae bacterium]|nr:hypothetical protein [Paracoccaceae bacterium]
MSTKKADLGCALTCWLVAALFGAFVAIALWIFAGYSFIQGAFIGAIALAVAGLGLSWGLCRPLPGPIVGSEAGAATPSAAGPTHAPPAPAP